MVRVMVMVRVRVRVTVRVRITSVILSTKPRFGRLKPFHNKRLPKSTLDRIMIYNPITTTTISVVVPNNHRKA